MCKQWIFKWAWDILTDMNRWGICGCCCFSHRREGEWSEFRSRFGVDILVKVIQSVNNSKNDHIKSAIKTRNDAHKPVNHLLIPALERLSRALDKKHSVFDSFCVFLQQISLNFCIYSHRSDNFGDKMAFVGKLACSALFIYFVLGTLNKFFENIQFDCVFFSRLNNPNIVNLTLYHSDQCVSCSHSSWSWRTNLRPIHFEEVHQQLSTSIMFPRCCTTEMW